MYLKSLVLKGFKSFADRSALSLESGVTAVVGPNGSGKSNISDAVLWVLGERNARHLRGQAMEDVIFSGSSARKPVSVAEVELVLDNSDATLPLDFDEVSIARRMYRSGESEYLINGVLARRMDVLDILHDTGIGTGTHSIISQGSLDTILQSRPEDRRALIEEAAGVLKHKQRKEKSARKLEAMDNHLARVRDVTAEVSRQLGPLERKAKRAREHEAANARLSEVRLALAVDDLRTLQRAWDAALEAERALDAEVTVKREAVASSERKVNDLQELIRRESSGAGDLAKSQRRAAQVSERLDSCEMLVREKRRAARDYEADVSIALDQAAAKRAAALIERDEAAAQLDEVLAAYREAEAKVETLAAERAATVERRRAVERAIETGQGAIRALERDLDESRRRQGAVKEDLAGELAHERLIDARAAELDADLARARDEHAAAVEAAHGAEQARAACTEGERAAQETLAAALARRDEARSNHDAARDEARAVEAEVRALEQALRASRSDGPALLWVLDNAERFEGPLVPLSQAIRAPQGMELLVERLLGEDLSALLAHDGAAASNVARALIDEGRAGDVSVVPLAEARPAPPRTASARSCAQGRALIDELSFSSDVASAVEALLGDVVVCDTCDEAFRAHEADGSALRFASLDGCVLYPSGKARVFGAVEAAHEGVLARERRLEELAARRTSLASRVRACEQDVASAEEACRTAQTASLRASQELARQRGIAQAAAADAERAERKLSSFVREAADVKEQLERVRKKVFDLRPVVDEVAARTVELESAVAAAREEHAAATEDVVPLRREAARLNDELNAAKLAQATLSERRAYAERVVLGRERDIAASDARDAASRDTLLLKRAAQRRAEPLLAVLELVTSSLRARARTLEEALLASESTANGFHASAAEARSAARAAHNALDEANARMTQARVDKGRLEVQVEAAVSAIVHDCGVPLDRVENEPALEDRPALEDEAFRLAKRIKAMGAVNPDAAAEYEQVKSRFDYLSAQLSDMEQARRALERIVRVIDRRMKDDFVRTFDQVNKNFAETFAVLFPGGTAELALVDPDDVERSGVEVTAQPRGKRITKMMLMSGGEKSLTALALLFAVYRIRKTPFYILDEVEAALDDTNLRRLVAYVDSLRHETQLIMITHQRRTMEMADVLFGVSMQADGVTKVVSQRLEHALEHAG